MTTLPYETFYGCNSLTSVSYQSSLTEIERYAYYGCRSLTSLDIPKSVQTIAHYAFGECTGLQEIKVYWENPSSIYCSDKAFYAVPKNTCELFVPCGRERNYASVYPWKEFKNIKSYSGIQSVTVDDKNITSYTVFGIDGRFVIHTDNSADLLTLPHGVYIVNGKKMLLN